MARGAVARRPILTVHYKHNWQELPGIEDEDGYIIKRRTHRCSDCNILATQDAGSTAYFVTDGHAYLSELSCDEIQILSILK